MRIETIYYDDNDKMVKEGDKIKIVVFDWCKEDYDGTEFIGHGQNFESEEFLFITKDWAMKVQTDDIVEMVKL